MTFPPDAFYARCYSTEQIEMIRGVYDSIIAEPWFTKDEARRGEFAAKLLQMFERGLVIPDKLHAFCLVMARHQFSEPPEPSEADQTSSQ